MKDETFKKKSEDSLGGSSSLLFTNTLHFTLRSMSSAFDKIKSVLISSSGSVRKSQDLLGTSIEGYLAIARSDLASEVENRQLRRLSFQLSKILSLSSRSIFRGSSRSILVTIMVAF